MFTSTATLTKGQKCKKCTRLDIKFGNPREFGYVGHLIVLLIMTKSTLKQFKGFTLFFWDMNAWFNLFEKIWDVLFYFFTLSKEVVV